MSKKMNNETHHRDLWKEAKNRILTYLKTDKDDLMFKLSKEEDSVLVKFYGEPFVYEAYYNEGLEEWRPISSEYPEVDEPALRIRLNVFRLDDQKMYIWDMDSSTFLIISNYRDKYGLEDWFYEVKLISNKESEYDISLGEAIRPQELKYEFNLKSLQQHDLALSVEALTFTKK